MTLKQQQQNSWELKRRMDGPWHMPLMYAADTWVRKTWEGSSLERSLAFCEELCLMSNDASQVPVWHSQCFTELHRSPVWSSVLYLIKSTVKSTGRQYTQIDRHEQTQTVGAGSSLFVWGDVLDCEWLKEERSPTCPWENKKQKPEYIWQSNLVS